MPKVSIVLPTYNGEHYIGKAIESIINQTYIDWELIIVDDCSTDNTGNIIEEFSNKDSRIQVIHNVNNKRLPASLNIGFRQAGGEYLTWTSDDNLYMDQALEKMVDFLDYNISFPMVCARMEVIDSQGRFLYNGGKYYKYSMFYNNCVGAGFMYRSSVVCDVGEYDESRFCIEDYEYWMRIIKKYGGIGFLDEILYKYRVHENSLTETKRSYIKEQLLKYRIHEIDWLLSNLKDHPELITKMYCDFIHNNEEQYFLNKAIKFVPELCLLTDKIDAEEYIVWGAGHYGEKAMEVLKNKIYCFADKNPDLVGKMLDGFKIISCEDMLKIKEKELCIAVGDEKVYELLKDLYQSGIKHCRIVQDFIY